MGAELHQDQQCAQLIRAKSVWGHCSQRYSLGGAVVLVFGAFPHEESGSSSFINLIKYVLRNGDAVGCSMNTEAHILREHTHTHTRSHSIASDMSQSVSSRSPVGEEAACPGEDVVRLHNRSWSALPGPALGADLQTAYCPSQAICQYAFSAELTDCHTPPVLTSLHWLPVTFRIQFEMLRLLVAPYTRP